MDGCCYLSWQRGGKGEIGAERYEKNSVTGQWAVLWEGGRGAAPVLWQQLLGFPSSFLAHSSPSPPSPLVAPVISRYPHPAAAHPKVSQIP